MKTSIHRRQFLKLMGTSLLSFLLQQCGVRPTNTEALTAAITSPPGAAQTINVLPTATALPSSTATIQPTATPNYRHLAAIGQINATEGQTGVQTIGSQPQTYMNVSACFDKMQYAI